MPRPQKKISVSRAPTHNCRACGQQDAGEVFVIYAGQGEEARAILEVCRSCAQTLGDALLAALEGRYICSD